MQVFHNNKKNNATDVSTKPLIFTTSLKLKHWGTAQQNILNKFISPFISFRNSRPVFCKKVVRNFTKFTGKLLCQSLFFNKVEVSFFKSATLLKRETLAQEFSCEL